jgi:hypothetical protein
MPNETSDLEAAAIGRNLKPFLKGEIFFRQVLMSGGSPPGGTVLLD